MKDTDTKAWERLVASARRAPESDDVVTMPAGFATRVVAMAFARGRERSLASLLERFSWKALGLAAGLAVASVAFNIGPILNALERDVMAAQDPVTALLDLS